MLKKFIILSFNHLDVGKCHKKEWLPQQTALNVKERLSKVCEHKEKAAT